MNWRNRLEAKRTEFSGESPSRLLTKPTKAPFGSFGSTQDDPSGNSHARLLVLVEADGLPAKLVTDMHADDLAAWVWFAEQQDGTDEALGACLRTLAKAKATEN